jgi:hypothetical protein
VGSVHPLAPSNGSLARPAQPQVVPDALGGALSLQKPSESRDSSHSEMRASATLDHVNSARQSWAGRLSGPTASYLAAFPGFEEIAQESLPDRLSTIVAREDEFEERFPDIFKKRQAAVRGGRE